MGARLIPARAGKTVERVHACFERWAHPRACGENVRERDESRPVAGSSPRVRGKHQRSVRGHQRPGLIPARAGKTQARARTACTSSAHPRACGENMVRVARYADNLGSSPRVRGKRGPWAHVGVRGRLIPARAGKTKQSKTHYVGAWAHPRACGENPHAGDREREGAGSSPRVRGKHNDACYPPLPPVAHPRACGENDELVDHDPGFFGSSPRVRGKPPARLLLPGLPRLIPARAGKTSHVPAVRVTRSAHPRACGENDILAGDTRAATGSSPRVRGKQRKDDRGRAGHGLIPARAGKTTIHSWRSLRVEAHPRACGENPSLEEGEDRSHGSSPRVRGKLLRWC